MTDPFLGRLVRQGPEPLFGRLPSLDPDGWLVRIHPTPLDRDAGTAKSSRHLEQDHQSQLL